MFNVTFEYYQARFQMTIHVPKKVILHRTVEKLRNYVKTGINKNELIFWLK